MKFHEIDWENWEPVDRATLLFVIRGGQALLIRKKRGLGAGKITAPGGRLEPGESPVQCAVREAREEVGILVDELRGHGELWFQFRDGYSILVSVFSSPDCKGFPKETEEAIPLWYSTKALPYGEMWEDDILWVPLMLAGESFTGKFLFEGEAMLGQEVRVHSAGPATNRSPTRGTK